MGVWLARGHQCPQPPRPLGSAQLPQRLGFDLPDALAGDVELLPDFFQRVLALAADAETQPDYFFFLRRQRLENACRFAADVSFDHGVYRRSHPAILNEIPKCGFTIAAYRSL